MGSSNSVPKETSDSSEEQQQAQQMLQEQEQAQARIPMPAVQEQGQPPQQEQAQQMPQQQQQASNTPLKPVQTAAQSAPPPPPQRMQAPRMQQQNRGYPGGPRRSCVIEGDTTVTSFADDDPLEDAAVAAATQAEPEPDTSLDGPVSVSTRIEYSALPSGTTKDVFGLVTVQAAPAPIQTASEEAERQPMDIVCVLDVSGSMGGDKLQQVQDATRFIIEQADVKDRLGVVAFNSNATRVLRLRKMNVEGKNEGNVATLRLQAGGGTSIASGLDMALSVMERRRQRNKVSAILLLTDGQDGSTRARIPELLRRATAANVTIYAFGFGADHDAKLLSDIAEQAQTPFTFVEDTEKIREAFAGAVGGLSSIVAQRVELTLKCQVPLKMVHTAFPIQQSEREATVTIPDMFALERRNILVELAVPADHNGAVLLEASARYIDLRGNRLVQTPPVMMEAQRVDEPQPEAEPDEEVSAQRERVEVTRALQDAAEASDRGQFDQALQVIEVCDTRMKSAKKKTAVSESLGQELADARNRMQNNATWEQGGRAEIRDATQMYKMERCTNMMQSSKPRSMQKSSKQMFCSPTQGAWIQQSKGNASSSSG